MNVSLASDTKTSTEVKYCPDDKWGCFTQLEGHPQTCSEDSDCGRVYQSAPNTLLPICISTATGQAKPSCVDFLMCDKNQNKCIGKTSVSQGFDAMLCADGLHLKCKKTEDCNMPYGDGKDFVCGNQQNAICDIARGACMLPPDGINTTDKWKDTLVSTIMSNILNTAETIKEKAYEHWIQSITNTNKFITGNYTFAEKYYNNLCYSILDCKVDKNAYDYLPDNHKLGINNFFIDSNKVTTYQFPYDLLSYSLFFQSSLDNYGMRLGAEQLSNNLIFNDQFIQLNMAKAKDLLALLFNDIDYYMRFYKSMLRETLVLETTATAYFERVPFKISNIKKSKTSIDATYSKTSLLKNLEEESTRRFYDLEWKEKIKSAHKVALYREMAIMLSHKINMSYRQNFILSKLSIYKVNELLGDKETQEYMNQLSQAND